MNKTTVMRILEQHKLSCNHYEYDSNITNGVEVATALNQNMAQVFKTLVTTGSDNNHYVFVVTVAKTLELKKGAKAVNVKSVEMIKQKDLFPLTGYIHGGCSPIGMKKSFKTVVDITATQFPTIIFSAGKVGYQVELKPQDLQNLINCHFDDIVQD